MRERAISAAVLVPVLLVVLLLLRLPDTARWYMMKGRRDRALETLRRTDPEADAEHELEEKFAAIAERLDFHLVPVRAAASIGG